MYLWSLRFLLPFINLIIYYHKKYSLHTYLNAIAAFTGFYYLI